MDNSFNVLDNQNRSDLFNDNEQHFPGRSVFPYGRSSIMTMNEGYLYPVDTIFVIPGDSVNIDFACYLECLNPFVDRQYSGMRLTFHAFYGKCEHQWRGWKAYATRGHRGNISLTLPKYSPSNAAYLLVNGSCVACEDPFGLAQVAFDKQGSLCSYLTGSARVHLDNGQVVYSTDQTVQQLMNSHYFGDYTQVNRPWRVVGEPTTPLIGTVPSMDYSFNALKFVFYQRIFRDIYLNKNLTKDNKNWWPDDDDDWILPYAATNVGSVYCHGQALPVFSIAPNNFSKNATTTAELAQGEVSDQPILGALRCRQWQGDPFTTSVPFLERNGTTELFQKLYSLSIGGSASSYDARYLDGTIHQFADFGESVARSSSSSPVSVMAAPAPLLSSRERAYSLGDPYINGPNPSDRLFTLLSLNQLAELSAASLWSRRNARAQGDYNSLIQAHYGINPDSEDKRPIYIGGSTIRLEFNDVVSQSAFESSNGSVLPSQPLGSITSRASAGGRISLPSFDVKDFGYIMILASLVPDTYYTQGIDEDDDPQLTGADLPWPEFANLDKEAVLLRRLFYSGDSAYDNKLIGYNERFLNYKYRRNRLLGHMLDYQDLKFRSMSFARYFSQNDIWNFGSIDNEFVTMTPYSVRDDMYSVPSQPHFILQFGDGIRLVRALPYVAKDSVLTNIA